MSAMGRERPPDGQARHVRLGAQAGRRVADRHRALSGRTQPIAGNGCRFGPMAAGRTHVIQRPQRAETTLSPPALKRAGIGGDQRPRKSVHVARGAGHVDVGFGYIRPLHLDRATLEEAPEVHRLTGRIFADREACTHHGVGSFPRRHVEEDLARVRAARTGVAWCQRNLSPVRDEAPVGGTGAQAHRGKRQQATETQPCVHVQDSHRTNVRQRECDQACSQHAWSQTAKRFLASPTDRLRGQTEHSRGWRPDDPIASVALTLPSCTAQWRSGRSSSIGILVIIVTACQREWLPQVRHGRAGRP